MLNPVVHENTTRNVIVSLMDFFTRFQIERYGSVVQGVNGAYISRKILRVPIQWAARDKWLEIYRSSSARKAMDPNIREKNPVEMQWILPRISFNLAGVVYDSTRRLIKTQTMQTNRDTAIGSINNTFTPGAYNLELEVAVISKTIDDQLQLMEQILPYFSPTLNLDIKLFGDRPAESVPFVLTSVTQDIPTDLQENDERFFTFTYSFTVKINYYVQPPITTLNAPVILLNGTGVPYNNVGETGFWYLQGAILGTDTASACHDTAIFYQKGATAWKQVWTAPSSGGWVVSGGPPTSGDLAFLPCGQPITGGTWYTDVVPPPSAAQAGNLFYYDTNSGKAYQKYCTWITDAETSAAPPPVSGDIVSVDWYYDSVADKYYKRVCAWVLVKEGLSSASRMVLWTSTHVHMYNDYIAVTDQWLEAQQRIQRRFEYFVATADIPNPFVDNYIENSIEN